MKQLIAAIKAKIVKNKRKSDTYYDFATSSTRHKRKVILEAAKKSNKDQLDLVKKYEEGNSRATIRA